MTKILRMTAVAILVFIAPAALAAFSFEPISMSLSPEGRGATGSFLLRNEGEEPVALRISLFERTMDLNGDETRVPADDLFVIYPSRIVLEPQSVQSLRVKWNGGAGLTRERSFRILVEQLAVDFGREEEQTSGLQIMFRYLGAIYVTPPGAVSDLVIESAVRTGDDRLEMVFHNRGNTHLIITDMALRFTETVNDGTATSVISVEELAGVEGENILAGARRRFFVSLPRGMKGDDIHVEPVFR